MYIRYEISIMCDKIVTVPDLVDNNRPDSWIGVKYCYRDTLLRKLKVCGVYFYFTIAGDKDFIRKSIG